jgi:hypothetical protein
MTRTARNGLEVLRRAPIPLFAGSAAWTILNAATSWIGLGPLLLGPALFGMFFVALKCLRGGHPTWQDGFDARRDPTMPLVAGIVFTLPFSLWNLVDNFRAAMQHSKFDGETPDIPGVPVVASLALLVFFSVYVFVFPVLADGCDSLGKALRTVHGLVESPPGAGSWGSALGRQIVYTTIILVGILIAALAWQLSSVVPYLFGIVASPVAIVMLASWYQERIAPTAGFAISGELAGRDGDGDDEADGDGE